MPLDFFEKKLDILEEGQDKKVRKNKWQLLNWMLRGYDAHSQ